MNSIKKITLISIISLAALIIGLSVWSLSRIEKNAYVDIAKLYDGFSLKKELESKYQNVESKRKTITDSLKLQLQVFAKQLEASGAKDKKQLDEFYKMRTEYQMKDKQFNEDNQALSKQYTEQILKQINQYVVDYGKKSGYDFIFGANSNGTIMYAKEKKDITSEMIVYINERYSGKQ
jgi:outer membrane protein